MDVQWHIDQRLVHEIHTSERRSFRACRRRWDWLFHQSYYPKVTAKPLEFGVAYHAAMEVLYNPDTWGWDRDVLLASALKKFVDTCEAQKAKALLETGHLYLDGEVEEDYEERVELGKGMIKYYWQHVAPKVDIGWKPVKVEIGFMVPIINPDTGEDLWCTCDLCFEKWWKYVEEKMPAEEKKFATKEGERAGFEGLPVVYAGRLDMLAQDEKGNYWIFDWKTARSIAENYEFLYLDDQIGSYVWALSKIGIHVKGFVYHEQRKGYPLPPKQNKQRRLGCLFSVAKNQDTDYDFYLRTVMEQDKEAYESGCYDDMLAFLKEEGIVYFDRHMIPKSYEELREIELNIGHEAMDMLNESLRIYPSPGRFGCNFCAFRQPCMEKNARGDYMYALETMFEKREHYYIRQEASTESKGGE